MAHGVELGVVGDHHARLRVRQLSSPVDGAVYLEKRRGSCDLQRDPQHEGRSQSTRLSRGGCGATNDKRHLPEDLHLDTHVRRTNGTRHLHTHYQTRLSKRKRLSGPYLSTASMLEAVVIRDPIVCSAVSVLRGPRELPREQETGQGAPPPVVPAPGPL